MVYIPLSLSHWLRVREDIAKLLASWHDDERCWVFSCRQLDSRETYLADVPRRAYKLRGSATKLHSRPEEDWSIQSKRRQDKFLCYQVVYKRTLNIFHDHSSNWEFIWRAGWWLWRMYICIYTVKTQGVITSTICGYLSCNIHAWKSFFMFCIFPVIIWKNR